MGLASCGALAWRFRGQLRVTAVVKATFAFVPGGTMRLEAPDDLHLADVPWGERASLWAASDRVPYRLFADIVLVGHAYLPPGGGVVRLAVSGQRTLVDKSVGVSDDVGDGAPVPLAYELAFGGPSSADNPVGTGMVGGSPLPSLIDPVAPRRAGGFGPLARSWPARARLLGSIDPACLEEPIADVPSEIDWGYFQAAPPGQLTDFLRGDESIRLEGMSREHPVLETRLPGATAAGRVYGLPSHDAAQAVPIAFHGDDLHLDADRRCCSLTFRASFSVPSEEVLPTLVLVAGIELPGQPIQWPASAPQPRARQPVTMGGTPKPPVTMGGTPQTPGHDGGYPQTPGHDGGTPKPPRAPQPSVSDQPTYLDTVPLRAVVLPSVPSSLVTSEATSEAESEAVIIITDDDSELGLETLPFTTEEPMIAPPAHRRQATMVLEAPAILEEGNPLMTTASLSAEQLATAMAFPFRVAEPGHSPAVTAGPAGDIPGAPWSAHPAPGEPTRSLVLDPRVTLPDDLLHLVAAPRPTRAAPGARGARVIPRPVVKSSVLARFDRPKRG